MKKKSIHLGVSGILLNSKGEVLLGRRSANDDAYPGYYCTPGGGVEFSETLDAALSREFVEEVGLGVSPGSIIHIAERIRPVKGKHTVLVFKRVRVLVPGIRPRPLDGFSSVIWLGREAIGRRFNEITPATFEALRVFLKL